MKKKESNLFFVVLWYANFVLFFALLETKIMHMFSQKDKYSEKTSIFNRWLPISRLDPEKQKHIIMVKITPKKIQNDWFLFFNIPTVKWQPPVET